MSETPTTRESRVNRDGDTELGIMSYVSASELATMGIDTQKFDSIQVTITEDGIELSGGELRDTREIPRTDEPLRLTHDEVPKPLSHEKVRERYPDEKPSDFGTYFKRQEKRLFALEGFECRFCEATDPATLSAVHETPVDEFGDNELPTAHGILELFVLCDSCKEDFLNQRKQSE